MRRIFDSPWFYYALAALLLVGAIVSQRQPAPQAARPVGSVEDIARLKDRDDLNVIFVLIDTLRANRLHVYGNPRNTSPNMDRLARQGIRFANAESQSSWTKASMASIWTGLYPERTGVQRFANALPEEAVLPAEIFKEAGYRTAGIWRNGWVANNFRFDQGFDLYVRPQPNRRAQPVKRHNPSAHALTGTDVDATESAMEFIEAYHDQRFFLYLHLMDTHQYLYADLSPDFGTSFSDIYDSSIYWVDHNIGILVRALEDRGLLDQTVIVIASDHGEAFFEHGREGHAQDLYREVLDVPLIVSLPFELNPGIVVEARVANVDIFPTILDLVGLPPIPQAEGRSQLPAILDAGHNPGQTPADVDRPIFAQLDHAWGKMQPEAEPIVSIVKGPYRMIQYSEPIKTELFDRSKDPGELEDVSSQKPEVVEEMRVAMEEFLAKPSLGWTEGEEIEITEMHRAQLRALGYMIEAPNPRQEQRREAHEKAKAERDAARAAAAGEADGS